MRTLVLLAGLAATLLVPLRAHAGLTITTQKGSEPGATLYLDGDHFKADEPKGERASTIIIDATAKKVTMVDATNRTYTEMTEADRARMKAQMDAMRAQMAERMKNMPPDQRAKMEAMMGPGGASGDKPHDWKFESMGQKKTVNGFACEMYRVSEDGKVREEQCVSPWSAGLVKKTDFAGIQKFAESMMDDLGGPRGHSGGSIFSRMEKAPGVPISRVPIEADGQRGEEEQIKSIKRGSIPASVFAVPAGYTKKDMPAFGPGGVGGNGHRHGGPPGP